LTCALECAMLICGQFELLLSCKLGCVHASSSCCWPLCFWLDERDDERDKGSVGAAAAWRFHRSGSSGVAAGAAAACHGAAAAAAAACHGAAASALVALSSGDTDGMERRWEWRQQHWTAGGAPAAAAVHWTGLFWLRVLTPLPCHAVQSTPMCCACWAAGCP